MMLEYLLNGVLLSAVVAGFSAVAGSAIITSQSVLRQTKERLHRSLL